MSKLVQWENEIDYGSNINIVEQTQEKTVFQMQDDTGEGTMVQYHILPGIMMIYNDFLMESCNSELNAGISILNINYCRKGRIEWEASDGRVMYIQDGDLQIETKQNGSGWFHFPSCYYHGITVGVQVDGMPAETLKLLKKFGIDSLELARRFRSDSGAVAYKPSEQVERIFRDLYITDRDEPVHYFGIKILELLLAMQIMDPKKREKKMYFQRCHVEAVKEIARLITGNPDRHYTIHQLSELYQIPSTTLKLCFKGVFGLPIGQYLREYRMDIAAKMLQHGGESVAEIAGRVGYDNQSKFAAAFKAHKGVSPKAYGKVSVYTLEKNMR